MTSRKPFTLLGAAAVPLVALGVAACGGGGGATAATTPPKPAAVTQPKTAAHHAVTRVRVANNSKLGKILVDSHGHTLYLFSKDTKTKSACSGACAGPWPPLRANGKLSAGSGVAASKLRTIKRSDGKPQVTYNGHPLYGFVMDTKAGQTKGEGLTAFGGHWFAVSPRGQAGLAQKVRRLDIRGPKARPRAARPEARAGKARPEARAGKARPGARAAVQQRHPAEQRRRPRLGQQRRPERRRRRHLSGETHLPADRTGGRRRGRSSDPRTDELWRWPSEPPPQLLPVRGLELRALKRSTMDIHFTSNPSAETGWLTMHRRSVIAMAAR